MPKARLTDKFVRSLKTEKDREDYWDASLPGFILRVYRDGKKNYEVIYRTVAGRRGRVRVGDATLLSLADARDRARELLLQIQKGDDPSQRKKDFRASRTFQELSLTYLDLHCKPHLRPRSISDIEYTLRSELLPAWSHRKASDISRADVISLIEQVGVKRNAPVRANHLRAVITGIFNFAVQRGIIGSSPCVGLPRKYRETPRARVLSESEIISFWNVTQEENPVIRDLFRVLLLLGQRSGETKQMQWSQIKDDVWIIPATVTKNKQEHFVPLPKKVLEILEAHRHNSQFVFTSKYGGCLKWLHKATARILKGMKSSSPWSVHDLRRTCATNLEKLNFADSVVSAVLNHSKISRLGVTGRYTRHGFLAEKRHALETWVGCVLELVERKTELKQPAKVITFARAVGE